MTPPLRSHSSPKASGLTSDVGSVKIGHYQRTGRSWRTGTTVIVPVAGAVAGVDVRGGGPGTRETDLLRPENMIQHVHAICLSGGSAFGLAAADGVMQELEKRRIGFPVGELEEWKVPIVPAAVIFDLGRSGVFTNRPDAEFGRRAIRRAVSTNSAQGSIGAGTGCRAGGLQGGVGMASHTLDSGIVVSALAVVNAVGAVINPSTCLPWEIHPRRLRRPDALDRRNLREYLASWQTPISSADPSPDFQSLNTTIGVVLTNEPLTKAECTKVASVAHDGLARAIRPAHSMNDGDTIFALSVGVGELAIPRTQSSFTDSYARTTLLNTILRTSAEVFSLACTEAIIHARSLGGPPSFWDLCPSAYHLDQ